MPGAEPADKKKKKTKKEHLAEMRELERATRPGGSGVNYSQVADRHLDDKRFERERAFQEQVNKDIAEGKAGDSAEGASGQPSATYDAFMRMATGQGERTIADKLNDKNRPTWEQYKKENEDKLDLKGAELKKMQQYRAELDAVRNGAAQARSRQGPKVKTDAAISDDDESDADDDRKAKKERKKKKKRKHDSDEDSDERKERKRQKKERKRQKKEAKKAKKRSGRAASDFLEAGARLPIATGAAADSTSGGGGETECAPAAIAGPTRARRWLKRRSSVRRECRRRSALAFGLKARCSWAPSPSSVPPPSWRRSTSTAACAPSGPAASSNTCDARSQLREAARERVFDRPSLSRALRAIARS